MILDRPVSRENLLAIVKTTEPVCDRVFPHSVIHATPSVHSFVPRLAFRIRQLLCFFSLWVVPDGSFGLQRCV